MDGIFSNRRWTAISNILGLVSGIFLAALFIFLMIVDDFGSDTGLSLYFIGLGILVFLLCAVSLYVNKNAYIHAEGDELSGYFHFGLALRCRIEEIEAISWGGTMLNLQLKNGKQYVMYNLGNAYELGKYIKQRMPLSPLATKSKEQLMQTVRTMGTRRRNTGFALAGCFVLIFAGIFLTVWLTDGREMRDFTAVDWQVFRSMIAADVLLMAAVVVLIRRFLRSSETFQQNLEDLLLLVLRTAPLPAGNPRHVYIAMDDEPPVRVTVCGFPHSEEVYYIAEVLTGDYILEQVHTSKVYPAMDALESELTELTEIQIPEKI